MRGDEEAPAIGLGGKLPRTARVGRRWEFDAIHRSGVRVHTQSFVIVGLRTVGKGGARIGSAVSRKVGNAVVRNRLRRLIKEVFRRMTGLSSVDLVVIAKPSARGIDDFSALAAELSPAFERASKLAVGAA